ncbi:putative UPF0481 protein At3g02645 [Tasmannia lanceolata]|uniref:putative UPF0481 protein At3g02645 n=1 Tax=Tasmannia lanceolata TaxID=3420 RepID=UPI004064A77B
MEAKASKMRDSGKAAESDDSEMENKKSNIPDWVISIWKEVKSHPSISITTIGKVPQILRKVRSNKACFDPEVVSLGPYHHEKPHLKRLKKYERLKKYKHMAMWRYTNCTDNITKAEPFYDALIGVVDEVKRCYEKKIEISNEDLAWMMLIDGCFVLEFMSEALGKKNNLLSRHDTSLVVRDMMLLENQLPFLVLKTLTKTKEAVDPFDVRTEIEQADRSVDAVPVGDRMEAEVLCSFAVNPFDVRTEIEQADRSVDPVPVGSFAVPFDVPVASGSFAEPFDVPVGSFAEPFDVPVASGSFAKPFDFPVACSSYVPFDVPVASGSFAEPFDVPVASGSFAEPFDVPVASGSFAEPFDFPVTCSSYEPFDGSSKLLGKKSAQKLEDTESTGPRWYSFRSATELKAAGIKFRRSETTKLSDVKFKSHYFCGELFLPPIVVDDSTKPKLLNSIAYELCPDGPHDYGISSYICLMDSLIDREEDVKELRSEGIVLNSLGSDQEVAQLFNVLATDLILDSQAYVEVKRGIESHCKGRWNVYMANLYYTHFNTPWTVITTIAAVFLLLLTAFQTYFTIYPTGS